MGNPEQEPTISVPEKNINQEIKQNKPQASEVKPPQKTEPIKEESKKTETKTSSSTNKPVPTSTNTSNKSIAPSTPTIPSKTNDINNNWSCSRVPRTCKQVGSRAEAQFYLEKCGATKFDRDRDGIACENL